MSILIGFLMVLTAIVCLLLVLIVLMQRPRQEGLGATFGAGMMDSLAGAHATNVLQKGTSWLGGLMFLLTFVLAALMAHNAPKPKGSLAGDGAAPPVTAPVAPGAPAAATTTPAPAPVTPEAEAKPAPAPENKPAETPAPAPAATTPAPAAPAAPATPAPAPAVQPAPVPSAPPTPPAPVPAPSGN